MTVSCTIGHNPSLRSEGERTGDLRDLIKKKARDARIIIHSLTYIDNLHFILFYNDKVKRIKIRFHPLRNNQSRRAQAGRGRHWATEEGNRWTHTVCLLNRPWNEGKYTLPGSAATHDTRGFGHELWLWKRKKSDLSPQDGKCGRLTSCVMSSRRRIKNVCSSWPHQDSLSRSTFFFLFK